MKRSLAVIAAGVFFCLPSLFAGQSGVEAVQASHVYVAPNVVQAREFDVFTTFTLTNATPFWFNPRIYLINEDGEIVRLIAPLIKGYGSWQKASVDLISDDFQGSVWIISPQPIVASAFIHQLKSDGSLSLLGNTGLERMDSEVVDAMMQRLEAETRD